MSEVASRPTASRGRGSGRGARGGFAGRGARRINGDKSDHKPTDDAMGAFDDEGDFAELRKQYGDKTSVIREMFPDWSDADVLFALQETNGDQNEAVARIAEGTISQWGEVSKPKKTTRAKAAKDPNHAPAAPETSMSNPRNTRGGRAVSDGGRGRPRGSERGGRGGRGRPANTSVNGARNKENQQLSVPTEESSAWDNEKLKMDNADPKPAIADKPAAQDVPQSAAPQTKTWASMLRQSTAPKPVPASKEPPVPKPAEPTELQPSAEPAPPEPEAAEMIEETTPVAHNAMPAAATIAEPPSTTLSARAELTETNLEQVTDASNPPATDTAASTAADSWDPRQSPVSATATPLSAAQHQHQAQRTTTSGFAASALKATAERSTRASSHQRRVLDQEEAVRMPGNREVDRTAVQFGAFNLHGGDEDIDGEREEPETRAQPPADSPVSHPRASLPPVSQPVTVPESYPQKPAAALPAGAAGVAGTAPAGHPQAPSAQQYGRFGHGGAQDVATASQKPADPFSHQSTAAAQPPYENLGAQSSQPQAQQPGGGAYSSAPSEYSNYYTANQPERNPYNFYAQQYGSQQGAHGQHEGGVPSQQRPFGGYNAQNDNLSQYPQSGGMHAQPRFGASTESQNSGHSTPNPTAQAQAQAQQQQAQQPQAQQPQQQGAPGTQPQSHGQQYPGYSHPYYSNPYYHQYYSGYGQGGFGPYGGKGGMYGQPYGVSPNAPYEQHASSPGTFGPSSLHRDSGLGSGLGDYGRAASGQAGSQPGLGGTSFGASHDSFARSFQSQGQAFNSQGQPPASGSSDELKSYGDAKTGSGPSPSLGGGPRPGSAANNGPGQSGLPPPQTSQMGGATYGGYPSHLQGHGLHGGSGYGMGAGGGASQHGSTPYGSYGQGFGSGGYYGGGQQQQRGGWGGNYH